ncbi:MAG: thiamine phosphate synthase [Candidatus Aminicenantes bacterium]|nr:thiamine phosphate synthase [Candidatus Aminicenantes bacterium]
MTIKIGKLHVITDTSLQSRFSHFELAELAISGGADTLQFRQKIGSTREMIAQSCRIKSLCDKAGVSFIVNDRLDVAIAAMADGVHLGQDDFPIPLARKILAENILIGGSASTLEEAWRCVEEGADYVGFGPVFPTSSKADAGPVSGIKKLKEVVDTCPVPIIAIGGITPENTREVLEAGAAGIAVISAVCCAQDPKEATQNLIKALRRGNTEGPT